MPRFPLALIAALLACPVQLAQADGEVAPPQGDVATLPVPAAYLTQLGEMLDAGFARQASSINDAKRHFESLRSQRADDPRVEYGLALVLLKNFRQSEAIPRIEAAIQKDPAYLPARQAEVRELLKGKKYAEVQQRLLDFSDLIGMFAVDPPPLAVRQAAAEWMGCITGFLEGPLGDVAVREQSGQTSAQLRVRLGAELRPAFDAGRVALSVAHRRLQDEEARAMTDASAQKQQQIETAHTKSQELSGQRERLEMTKDQWDAWVREQVGEIDSRLGALEKRYAAAESDLRAISDAATLNRIETQRLLSILERQEESGTGRFPLNRAAMQAQLAARQAELDQLLVQYDATDQERAGVLQAAQGLLGDRQSSLNRYQEATGQAARRIRQLKQWDQRLQAETEKLAKTPDRKAQGVTAVRRRMQTWSTYDDFQLDAEKARLLAEYEAQ